MAIYPAKNSLLKIEYPAGAGVYTTVALLTQLSIDQSAPTIQAGGLLFQQSAPAATRPTATPQAFCNDWLKAAHNSAPGFTSTQRTTIKLIVK
jgi:hypothetical protein